MKKENKSIVKSIRTKIINNNFMKRHRFSEKDFSRKRKLPFTLLILFILNLVRQTLQKELTQFVSLFSDKKVKNITKSAFCQSRMKLKHTAFMELNDILIDEFYTDNEFNLWKGFRLLGVDGSKLQLPTSKELIETFGGAKNNSDMIVPMAQSSTCYDLLNEIMVDSVIERYEFGEYNIAIQHLEKSKENDLLIYDRGYEAIWFLYYHVIKKRNFVIRMTRGSINDVRSFFESEEISRIIEINSLHESSEKQLKNLGIEFKPFKIRLVKVILDGGEVEVLATSLLDDKKYLSKEFKWIYGKRWGIEVNYDHLKNHLLLEDFTGMSELSIKQDFYANSFIVNLHAIISKDAQTEINIDKEDNKHKYKTNKNLSLGFMKDKVVNILRSNNPKYYEELKILFKLEPVPVRSGRRFPRIFRTSKIKFHINKKRSF
jgi:hypothetical protein